MGNPLQQLGRQGQSVWLDFISRELVTGGELERMIAEDNVTGLTSNPTIFAKALAEGHEYDDEIRSLMESGVRSPADIFLRLAASDIRRACDAMREVHDRTGGNDGFVSLEVSPLLAHDTEGTVAAASAIWTLVDRPNLMVKIPATPEGIPAIERTLAAGINVNVTLIFSLASYRRVMDAYVGALETRHQQGLPLTIRSVASFFVSRVDTETDDRLERLLSAGGNRTAIEPLLGKAAIANAVLAYEAFEGIFRNGERFGRLRSAGAAVQRPLWASTSAKNPRYRDVVYAEALVGPDTVDTMPPATILAFRDHGVVAGDTVRTDYAGAHSAIERLAEVGIDIDDVTETLLQAGVASFAASYDQLLGEVTTKVDQLLGGYLGRQHLSAGPVGDAIDKALHSAEARTLVHGIWARDPNIWKPDDPAHAKVITNRLGWLDVITRMQAELPRLLRFGQDLLDGGVRDVVLLGMGGSSLCPEVLRTSFSSAAGYPTLHVLDTTDPAAIRAVGDAIDLHATVFLVASKSGGTIETLSHLAHFWEAVRAAGVSDAGKHFVAITDPGTSLAATARERGFREIFENPPDIGGRYSALSFFGLVPASALGIDVELLLERASRMHALCGPEVPTHLNCGAFLGTAMGRLHAAGRDKVTIIAPDRIGAFSLWAEQLIAESTGKEGRGLIPVGAEPVGAPDVYGSDRFFVVLRLEEEEPELDRQVAALQAAGHPLMVLQLDGLYDLGAEFFRWEMATAVAAHDLRIDPFDEPNVKESKDNTAAVLDALDANGQVVSGEGPGVRQGDLTVFGGEPGASATDALRHLLTSCRPGDYVAIMAYLTPATETLAALQDLRVALRDDLRVATTLGWGPRFLHSTGQLHKGGPPSGIFIQITADDAVDVSIPGERYSFSVLKQAQAAGDLRSLRTHGRRVLRCHISGDVPANLARIATSLRTSGAAL